MEKTKVDYREKATDSILKIASFIEERGYPETAEKFANELYDFGLSIGKIPQGYPLCRHLFLAKLKMHCAVFRKNYIFVYKIVKKHIIIYNNVSSGSNNKKTPVYFLCAFSMCFMYLMWFGFFTT